MTPIIQARSTFSKKTENFRSRKVYDTCFYLRLGASLVQLHYRICGMSLLVTAFFSGGHLQVLLRRPQKSTFLHIEWQAAMDAAMERLSFMGVLPLNIGNSPASMSPTLSVGPCGSWQVSGKFEQRPGAGAAVQYANVSYAHGYSDA